MENYIHLFFTSTILIQNVLSRFAIIDHKINFNTLLLYTFVDCLYLYKNDRIFSLILHHIACCDLVYAALTHHPYINCHDLVVLEITTFLNVLYRLCKNPILRIVKNGAWITIRLIMLPLLTIRLSREVMAYDYQIFLRYSFSLMMILILSFEWTNEVLKTNIKYISSSVYIIPIIHYIHTNNLLGCIISSYIGVSSAIFNRGMRFENRMLINFTTSFILLL